MPLGTLLLQFKCMCVGQVRLKSEAPPARLELGGGTQQILGLADQQPKGQL